MSFNMGSQKTKSQQTTERSPYEPTIPLIKDFLSSIPKATGTTGAQSDAFGDLTRIAERGDPNAQRYNLVARQNLKYDSTDPMAMEGYDAYNRRMSPVADGTNQDIGNDEYLQKLLAQVGDEASNATRARFAAAGRDFSGMENQTVSRGVAQAQTPILVDQLNRERARTDAAAGNLFSASQSTAQNVDALRRGELDQRLKGMDAGKAALDAKMWGPNSVLNLQEQLKTMPYDELSKIAALLFPAAQLGGKQESEGSQKTKSTGFGLTFLGGGR